MFPPSENLIWIDLEMTGLDTDRDYIIEIATVITNSRLNIIAEGPIVAIHQTPEVISAMDKWNTEHHGQSGLIKRVEASTYSAADAEQMTLAFLKKFVLANTSPMCGNGVCQDRRFLHRLMPQLEQYFHYRSIDVSSIKEVILRWYPDGPKFNKDLAHVAIQDVHDSINELIFFRDNFFIEPTE